MSQNVTLVKRISGNYKTRNLCWKLISFLIHLYGAKPTINLVFFFTKILTKVQNFCYRQKFLFEV